MMLIGRFESFRIERSLTFRRFKDGLVMETTVFYYLVAGIWRLFSFSHKTLEYEKIKKSISYLKLKKKLNRSLIIIFFLLVLFILFQC